MNKQLYEKLIKLYFNDKYKKAILKELSISHKSVSELIQSTKCYGALMSYHLNGNLKSEGLLTLGLIEKVFKDNTKMTTHYFKITSLGLEVLRIIE